MKLKHALVFALVATAGACQSDSLLPPTAGSSAQLAAGDADGLFEIEASPRLTVQQAARLSRIAGKRTSQEVHVVRLHPSADGLLRRGSRLRIALSPSASRVATGATVVRRGVRDVSWAGPTADSTGWIQLVLGPAGVYGSIRSGAVQYKIEPLGGALHALTRIDGSRLPPEHPPTAPSGVMNDESHTSGGFGSAALQRSRMQLNTTQAITSSGYGDVSIVVVYTAAAAAATADIGTLIQLAIDETNTSYTNSGVTFAASLVHTSQVSYNEANRSYQQHVSALQSYSDGLMDAVHGLRNQYLGDVVMLVVDDKEACGMASTILATHASGFAVVDESCATGYYSFAHELGHLQGARHDRHVDNSNTPFQYGHGYVDPGDAFRTIMAYGDACNNCSRIQYWSSSYTPIPFLPRGTASYEDNVRVLNETKYHVASFRAPISVSIYGPTSVKSTQWCTWNTVVTGNVGAASYEWSGLASGNQSAVTEVVMQSGPLSVIVYDSYGRGSDHTIWVTVDDFAPDC